NAAPRVRDADQAETVVSVPRARGRGGRAGQGLGGGEGRVRHRRGVRPGGGRAAAVAVDRDPPLRPARGRRPGLIRPQGDTLALETLFFADDVRSKTEIEEAVEATDVKKAELELAGQVIQSLVGEWNPA